MSGILISIIVLKYFLGKDLRTNLTLNEMQLLKKSNLVIDCASYNIMFVI